MHSTLLIVNSLNRTSGTPSNFTYSLNQSKFSVDAFRLLSFTCANSWYSIFEQTFYINNTAFFLDAGNYSILELVAELKSQIQLIYPDFSINYYNIPNKVVLSNINPFTATFEDNLARALGFDNSVPLSPSAQSKYVVNMQNTNNLYISCPELGLYINSYFINKTANVISVIPVSVNSNNFIAYQPQNPPTFQVDSRNISNLSFQIYNDRNELVDFINQDVTIVLELFSNYGFI